MTGLDELSRLVDAATAAGDEGSLRQAWEAARAVGGRDGWRQGARCLDALGIDRFQLTWSTFMGDGAEVHVVPHALDGPALPDPDAGDVATSWIESVDRSVEHFVKLGYLVRCSGGRINLGPTPPQLPALPTCVRCLDDRMCMACEGCGARLENGVWGPCKFCEGHGACPGCGLGPENDGADVTGSFE